MRATQLAGRLLLKMCLIYRIYQMVKLVSHPAKGPFIVQGCSRSHPVVGIPRNLFVDIYMGLFDPGG